MTQFKNIECPHCSINITVRFPEVFEAIGNRKCAEHCKRYRKLLEFIKSIANHFNLNETEMEFVKFCVDKENEAEKLLKEIGEL